MTPEDIKKASKRFTPSRLSERLIPILLGLLLAGLMTSIIIVALSLLGLTPGA